jgi:hypothetical protein
MRRSVHLSVGLSRKSNTPLAVFSIEGGSPMVHFVCTNRLIGTFFNCPNDQLFRAFHAPFHSAFISKKPEVTWCYNPAEGITLFGSTPYGAPNKLLPKAIRDAVRCHICATQRHSRNKLRRRSNGGLSGRSSGRTISWKQGCRKREVGGC